MLDMWKEKKSQWMKHGFYVSPIKTKKTSVFLFLGVVNG
jgi:hypothetical protein